MNLMHSCKGVAELLSQGLNASLAVGRSDDDNPAIVRKQYAYGKLGYISGKHAASADHGRGEDFALIGDTAKYLGVG